MRLLREKKINLQVTTMCTALCVTGWRLKQIKMERMFVCDFTRLRVELTDC